MKAFLDTKYCSYFNFHSLYNISKDQLYRISGSEFYEWLFRPEKFSGRSSNGPRILLFHSLTRKDSIVAHTREAVSYIVIWPVRPRTHFHCKGIKKIPVWGPYVMARARPEKAVRPCSDRVRPSYGDFINSARKMRTKTTLLLYKSWLFGQNEQHSKFCYPKKKKKTKKEKRGGHIIKCLLTELGQCAMTSGQIFSHPALPLSQ